MRRSAILLVCLMAVAVTGITVAQPARGAGSQEVGERGRQPVIGPGVQNNMIATEKVMREIHQLMFLGPFTPRQATEVTDMMTRLGVIMQEMAGPQADELAKKHDQELKEIRHRIKILKQQLQTNQ
jgi:hypothetical protein